MKIKKTRTVQIKQYEPMLIEAEEECTPETLDETSTMLDSYIEAQVKGMEILREGLK